MKQSLTANLAQLLTLAREEAQRGRYAAAYRCLSALPTHVRHLPDVLLMQANLAMHQRRYATALRHYDTLLAAVEVCLSVHLNRIECLIQLGRLDEAEATLETDASPLQGHFGRHVMLARLAARRQQSQRARAQVESACQLNSQALSSAAAFPELSQSVWQIACAVWPTWQIETQLVCSN